MELSRKKVDHFLALSKTTTLSMLLFSVESEFVEILV